MLWRKGLARRCRPSRRGAHTFPPFYPSTRQTPIDMRVFLTCDPSGNPSAIVRPGVNFGRGDRGRHARDRGQESKPGLRQSIVSDTRSRPLSPRALVRPKTLRNQKEDGDGPDSESEALLCDLCVPLWQFQIPVAALPRCIRFGQDFFTRTHFFVRWVRWVLWLFDSPPLLPANSPVMY